MRRENRNQTANLKAKLTAHGALPGGRQNVEAVQGGPRQRRKDALGESKSICSRWGRLWWRARGLPRNSDGVRLGKTRRICFLNGQWPWWTAAGFQGRTGRHGASWWPPHSARLGWCRPGRLRPEAGGQWAEPHPRLCLWGVSPEPGILTIPVWWAGRRGHQGAPPRPSAIPALLGPGFDLQEEPENTEGGGEGKACRGHRRSQGQRLPSFPGSPRNILKTGFVRDCRTASQ